jgi:hypothetical protein
MSIISVDPQATMIDHHFIATSKAMRSIEESIPAACPSHLKLTANLLASEVIISWFNEFKALLLLSRYTLAPPTEEYTILSSLRPDMPSCLGFGLAPWLCAADEERCLDTAASRFEADAEADADAEAEPESEAGPDFLVIRSNGRSDMGKEEELI